VVVLSIAAPNESVCHPRDVSIDYVFDYGGDVDVVLFPGHHKKICREVSEKPVRNRAVRVESKETDKTGLCVLEDL